MKECDIFRGSKHTLAPPTHFQGCKTTNPRIYAAENLYINATHSDQIITINGAKHTYTYTCTSDNLTEVLVAYKVLRGRMSFLTPTINQQKINTPCLNYTAFTKTSEGEAASLLFHLLRRLSVPRDSRSDPDV